MKTPVPKGIEQSFPHSGQTFYMRASELGRSIWVGYQDTPGTRVQSLIHERCQGPAF